MFAESKHKEAINIAIFNEILSFLLFFLQVIQNNQNLTSKTADPPSAAILAIYLDQAHALPVRLILFEAPSCDVL